jgi:hypothetical protein
MRVRFALCRSMWQIDQLRKSKGELSDENQMLSKTIERLEKEAAEASQVNASLVRPAARPGQARHWKVAEVVSLWSVR